MNLKTSFAHPALVARDRSPIEQLPNELLGEILVRCLPGKPSFRADFAPLLLSQVCSRWRHVVLEASQLWTDICLDDDNLHRKDLLSLLNTWLKRSNGRLIDVYIDRIWVNMTSRNIYERRAKYQSLLAVLHAYCNRIRSLSGTFPKSIAGDLFLSETTSLERVSLEGILPNGIDSLVPARVDFSTHLPCLTEVTCLNLPLNTLSICNQTQLRKLMLNSLSVQDACALLAALPHLEHANFELISSGKAEPVVGRTPLPALRGLRIVCDLDAHVDPRAMFISFTAPDIETLTLDGLVSTNSDLFWSESVSWDALKGFVLASGAAHLRELYINRTADIDIFFLDILRAAPELRVIESHSGPINGQVLRELTWDRDDPDKQLVPRLETLRLSAICGFKEQNIVPFLRSRAYMVKYLEIWDCTEVGEDIRSLGIPVTEVF